MRGGTGKDRNFFTGRVKRIFLIGKCGDKNLRINEVKELKVSAVAEDTLSTFSILVSY